MNARFSVLRVNSFQPAARPWSRGHGCVARLALSPCCILACDTGMMGLRRHVISWLALLAVVTAACLVAPVSAHALQPQAIAHDLTSQPQNAPAGSNNDSEIVAAEATIEESVQALEPAAGEGSTEPFTSITAMELHSDVVVVGLSWASDAADPLAIKVRYLNGGGWSTPVLIEAETNAGFAAFRTTEPMAVTNASDLEFSVTLPAGARASDYKINVIDPTAVANESSVSSEELTLSRSTAQVSNVAASYGLTINTRMGWGADESIRDDYDMAEDHKVVYRGAVVHHTASSNDYTQAQVPSLIRGFYYYHAVTNGWGDIGYQLLVDRFGGVWEGRYGSLERVRLGTHALGGNYETFGVSVIGTYSEIAPSAAAQESTAKAIAWMFDTYGISNPKGTIWVPGSDGNGGLGDGRIVDTISGHRQVSVTACPGQAFFDLLPSIRNRVDAIISPPLTGKITRLGGADRFETSAKLVLDSFSSGADTVFLAAGTDFPDALAGGPVAGSRGAPLLLTSPSLLQPVTKEALDRLKPSTLVLLGGNASITPALESVLRKLSYVTTVTRIGGETRYATAASIAASQFTQASTVYIANGENFPDALSGGPSAGSMGAPLLLSRAQLLPPETVAALEAFRPSRIVVLGGEASISSELERTLRVRTGASITRLFGADRYETSARIVEAQPELSGDVLYVSSGAAFPDALSSGSVARSGNAAMLLVDPSGLSASTQSVLRELRPKRIVMVGGPASLSRAIERQLDVFIVE